MSPHSHRPTNENASSKGLPRWLIRLCDWIWRWQILVWSLAGIEFIVNYLVTYWTQLTTLPLQFFQWVRIYWWLLLLVILLEFCIYLVSHPSTQPTDILVKSPKPPLPWWFWRLLLPVIFVICALIPIFIYTIPTIVYNLQPSGIGINTVDGHAAIGLCNGTCIFDTDRLDGDLKGEAQRALQQNNTTAACSYWNWASSYDTTDAEAKIYLENQQCDASYNGGYITYIVVASLPNDTSMATRDNNALNYGRDLLQGVYIAQREFNKNHPEGPHLRLYIANIGSPSWPDHSTIQNNVADQITQAVAHDSHIVAVTGLPFGSGDLITRLSETCIPMISIAPLDSAQNIPCFHSVAPSLQDEARATADYVDKSLHAQRISIVYDEGDTYSEASYNAFQHAFSGQFSSVVPYAEGSNYSITTLAQDITVNNPDLVYFAGPAEDAGLFLAKLREAGSSTQVMGNDNTYQFVHAPRASKADFNGVFFTSYAYPDEWNLQNNTTSPPAFIQNYSDAFNPDQTHAGNPYGYSRADSTTILAYDATSLLNDALDNIQSHKRDITTSMLSDTLQTYTFAKGLSGRIAYSSGSSSPSSKAVLILQIQDEKTHSIQIESGSF